MGFDKKNRNDAGFRLAFEFSTFAFIRNTSFTIEGIECTGI